MFGSRWVQSFVFVVVAAAVVVIETVLQTVDQTANCFTAIHGAWHYGVSYRLHM